MAGQHRGGEVRSQWSAHPAAGGAHQSWRHTPQTRNINALEAERLTAGQRIADEVAAIMGSWRFIITQSAILACWIALNIVAVVRHWDPYPFILLNLALSFQAAYAAPVIMMSQSRQAAKDRLQADEDYRINVRAEEEIAAIQRQLAQFGVAEADERRAHAAFREEQLRLLREIRAALPVSRTSTPDDESVPGSHNRTYGP